MTGQRSNVEWRHYEGPGSPPTNEGNRSSSSPPRIPMKSHQCQQDGCSASFDRPSSLVQHMFTHTGERPHVCAHCEVKRFATTSNLYRHMRGCPQNPLRGEQNKQLNIAFVKARASAANAPHTSSRTPVQDDDEDEDSASRNSSKHSPSSSQYSHTSTSRLASPLSSASDALGSTVGRGLVPPAPGFPISSAISPSAVMLPSIGAHAKQPPRFIYPSTSEVAREALARMSSATPAPFQYPYQV